MNIDHIAENYGAQALRSSGIEPKKRADEKKQIQGTPAAKPDQIQISAEAKALKEKAGLVATAKQALDATPEPSLSGAQVQQVYARIMNQHYDSKQVLESIVDSLFKDGTQLAKQSDVRKEVSGPVELAELSPQKIDEVQSNIETGFYENNEVFDVILRELFS